MQLYFSIYTNLRTLVKRFARKSTRSPGKRIKIVANIESY